MSVSEFEFSVCLSDCEPSDPMLGDVARTVFRQIGCAAPVVADLVERLDKVVASVNGATDVRVHFRGHAGSCEVTVLAGTREVWRTRTDLHR